MDLKSLETLGAHVARREDALLDAVPPEEGVRRAIAEHAAGQSAHKSRRGTWRVALIAAVTVGAAAATGTWIFTRDAEADAAPLSFTVGEPPRTGVLRQWVSGRPATDLPVRFSDGSKVTLAGGSRGRVLRVSPSGAELVIESGRAIVEVVPRANADYRVRTGPFDIEVTGTRFVAAYQPEHDEFLLELHEGRVTVTGCGLGDGVSIGAGQRLEASCSPSKFAVSSLGEPARASSPSARPARAEAPSGEAAAAQPVATATTAPDRARDRLPAAPRSAGSAPAANASWRELARQGHFRNAYQAARGAGFERECSGAGADELLLLGDAARLSGHADHASYAYRNLRARFAGSAAAAQAAFNLGRLGTDGDAKRWFETYLAERPSGPLAEAALGRLFETEVQRGGAASARDLARRYLERFPGGAHADKARRVLGALPAE
jgi:transmembrane sensor